MKRRTGTARLRKINDAAKECAEVIAGNVAGRPPKYHPHFVTMIEALGGSLIGSTNSQLARMFGVDEATIDGWMVRHPIFNRAIKYARSAADELVEASLLARARGYTHPEVKVFCAPRTGEIMTHEVVAHYPPDSTALIFWLKNRRPEQWRDKRDETNVPTEDSASQLRADLAEMERRTNGDKEK
jgi:hypothetical protein